MPAVIPESDLKDMPRRRQRHEILEHLAAKPGFPRECWEILAGWPVLVASPYSRSYYSMRGKRWDFTPEGCERVSDHWNYLTRRRRTAPEGGKRHCPTDRPVPNGTHWAHAIYDASARLWRIQRTWPKHSGVPGAKPTGDSPSG